MFHSEQIYIVLWHISLFCLVVTAQQWQRRCIKDTFGMELSGASFLHRSRVSTARQCMEKCNNYEQNTSIKCRAATVYRMSGGRRVCQLYASNSFDPGVTARLSPQGQSISLYEVMDDCPSSLRSGNQPIQNRILLPATQFQTPTPTRSEGWSTWSEWGSCSKSCDRGVQSRTRECATCRINSQEEKRFCNQNPCSSMARPVAMVQQNGNWIQMPIRVTGGRNLGSQVNPKPETRQDPPSSNVQFPVGLWSNWQQWSDCSQCGGRQPALKVRKRQCQTYGCRGNYVQNTQCSCPSPAQPTQPQTYGSLWSEWSVWSNCNKPCGPGQRQRVRECGQPGACAGSGRELSSCNQGSCAPTQAPAAWSNWGSWQGCSQTCGAGNTQRQRKCQGYGKCQGNPSQQQGCYQTSCPTWTAWSQWGSCTSSCGQGTHGRNRQCNGGQSCPGRSSDSKPCAQNPCPTWTQWSGWQGCSVTCGSGTTSRTRTCQYGSQCSGGSGYAAQSCQMPACAPTCAWRNWSQWSGCNSQCGPGQQSRTRTANCYQSLSGNPAENRGCSNSPCQAVTQGYLDPRMMNFYRSRG